MKMKHILISLFLIAALLLFSGCDVISDIISEPEQESAESSEPSESNNTANPIDPDWEPQVSEAHSEFLPDIASVVALVKPSVVAINTEVVTVDFFNRAFTQEGAGSGWIISEDGIIVTNNHVVAGAQSITVTMDDGKTYPVDMSTVATDPLTDLAVMKINATNLPAAKVGDSSVLRLGDWVVAIGNSLGQGIRATLGIVSLKDVSIMVDQGQTLYGLIETDAAINPGNSGGPLVNMAGEVIGINSVKAAEVDVEAVGWAISTEVAVPIIQALINNGYVVRPWLGINLYTVDDYLVFRYGLSITEGVLVTEVVEDSPACNCELEPGDIIVKFGDSDVTNVSELTKAIHEAAIGDKIEITYWRGEEKFTTIATLTESPPPS